MDQPPPTPVSDEVNELLPGIPFARPIHWPVRDPLVAKHPIFLPDLTRRNALLDIAVAGALLIAVDLIAGGVIGFMLKTFSGYEITADEPSPEFLRAMLLPTLVIRTLSVSVVIFLLARRRGLSARSLGVDRRQCGINLVLGLPTLAVAYGLVLATMLSLSMLWPEIMRQMNENAERIMAMVPRYHPLTFAGITFSVGWYEELLFRGFLLPRFRRITGRWWLAVLFSTIIFTSLHALDQTRSALILITILSLVFSVVTIWRRSILPAVVAHALFDLSQFLGLYYMEDSWT